jgi:HlyD family secretion protein
MKYMTMMILVVILLAGCSRNNEKSDGYGIFETDAVIVASEVQGKLLQFSVERGLQSEAGSVAALIDTMQVKLKLDQIEAQKKAVVAGRKSVEAQIAVYQEQKKNIANNLKRLEAMFC